MSNNKNFTIKNGLTVGTTEVIDSGGDWTGAPPPLYIPGTGSTAGTWLGTIPNVTAYYEGLSFAYKIPVAGASTTTLNINNLGAQTLYFYGTAKLTTHYPVGSVINLSWSPDNGGCFYAQMFYDTTDDYRIRWQNNITAGVLIHGYQLLLEGADGTYYPVTEGGNNSTTNTVSTAEFKIGGNMLWYDNSTDIAANTAGGAYSLYQAYYSGTMEFWSNRSTTAWATINMPVYLVGTINANGNFVLDNSSYTSFLTQTLPTTDDGKVYIEIGLMGNTSDTLRLDINHPIYWFKDGSLKLFSNYALKAEKLATARTINGVSFDGTTNITIYDSTKAPLASPALTGTPTAPTATAGTNTTQLATTAFVSTAVSNLINSAPAALDTLNELAAALGNDASFSTTVTNALAAKAPLASPALTGTPTAPTATAGTNTTQIATTAFVTGALGSYYTNSTSDARYWRNNNGTLSITTSNPFDDAHTETQVTGSGAYLINYTGASAHMVSSYVGGSASVLQTGAHYDGNNFYMRVRTDSASWKPWRALLHSGNYNSYSPTLTGTGASGTWSISVTGNAGTVTNGLYTTTNFGGDVSGTYNAIVVADDSHNHAFNNLTAKTSGTGTYTTSGDFRAPIFYDSNNTAYYIDSNGTSQITDAYANRYFQRASGIPTNNLGDPTITEMALFDRQFDNKTAFYPIANLKFFTSTDGVTWTENTSFSDTTKKAFLGGDGTSGVYIPNGTPYFRIELTNKEAYVYLNALYMYWSGSGNVTTVQIQKRRASDDAWLQHTSSTTTVGSWPGHLYMPFPTIPYIGPSSTSSGHYDTIRIDFQVTWNNANNISLYNMELWGGYPAGKRNIYTTDYDQNVTFPAITYSSSSFRAPIFYDLDNTGYYIDPASTSLIKQLEILDGGGGNLLYGATSGNDKLFIKGLNYTHSLNLLDSYNTSNYATISGGYTTQSLITLNGYSAQNTINKTSYYGSDYATVNGTITGQTDIRSPIFYDSDNTGFYANLASTSADSVYTAGGYSLQSGDGKGLRFWNDDSYKIYMSSTGNGTWGGRVTGETTSDYNIYFRIGGGTNRGFVFRNASTNVAGIDSVGRIYSGDGRLYLNNSTTNYIVGTAGGVNSTIYVETGGFYVRDYSGTNTRLSINSSGNVTANVDVRAPIFYDSDDTAYYTNPAGLSVLNEAYIFDVQLRRSVTSASGLSFYSPSYDTWQMYMSQAGTASSGARATILAPSGTLVTSWALRSYIENSAGYGWTFESAAGSTNANPSVVAEIRASDGAAKFNGSVRSPIFYDSDNTAFYFDGASTTNINALSGNGKDIFATSDSYLRINQASTFTSGIWLGSSHLLGSSGYFGWGSNGSTTTSRVWINSGTYNGSNVISIDGSNGIGTAAGSWRAPAFYDTDNTSYYVDPTSTSVLNNIQYGITPTAANGGKLLIGSGSPYSVQQQFGTDNTGWRYGIAKNAGGTVTTLFYVQDGGQVWAQANMQAPIFYDSDNTAYFLDAAGNSVFSAFNVGGGEVYVYGSATNALGIRTGAGGAYKYFNFDASGNFHTQNGSVYSYTFYDKDNTAYYVDGAGTSNLYRLTLNPGTNGVGTGLYVNGGDITAARSSSTGVLYFGTSGSVYLYYDGSNYVFGSGGGYTYNNASFRAPLFYDSDNTAYYFDGAGITRTNQLTRTNSRVSTGETYPLGHYTPGDTVFEIDPTWSETELQNFFNSSNVSWSADSTAPGGYSIYINGAVNVGGAYSAGFPFIPVDTNDVFYMECWIKNVGGGQTHYMGSNEYDHNFSSLGGNPGSYGYWVMSGTDPTTGWTKVSGYIRGFDATTIGYFEPGTKYWTPMALFNYAAGTGTRACYISGWKAVKVTRYSNIYLNAGWSGENGEFRIREGSSDSHGAYMKYTSSDTLEFGTRNGSTTDMAAMWINRGAQNVSSGGSFRAPIFYDSNDTTYYVDPATATILAGWSKINLTPGSSTLEDGRGVVINGSYTDGRYSTRFRKWDDGGGLPLYIQQTTGTANVWSNVASFGSSNARYHFHADGIIYTASDVRAASFVDANDTAYFLDPSATGISLDIKGDIRSKRLDSGSGAAWDTEIFLGETSNSEVNGTFPTYITGYGMNVRKNSDGVFLGLVTRDGGTNFDSVLGWGDDSDDTLFFRFNNVNKAYLNSSAVLYAAGDVRAPIFYDSDNTTYYVNPNGTSYVSGEFQVQQSGISGLRIVSGTGTQSLWIRAGYDTDGSATPAVSATNIQFQSSGSSGGSFTFVSGNTKALTISGDYAQGAASLRAPIFYDSNDTSYYVDPTSWSTLNAANVYGEWQFRSNKGSGVYLGSSSSPPLQAFSNDGGAAFMSFHRSGQYAVNMGLDPDNYLRIGGWSASANRWVLDMSGNNWVASSSRAPIFYDSDNTAYYVDAASTTLLNDARANIFYQMDDTINRWDVGYLTLRNASPTIYFRDTDHSSAMLHCNSNLFYILRGGTDTESWTQVNGQWPMYIELNTNHAYFGGLVQAVDSHRAPVFYDSANTAWYVNPDASSRVSGTFEVVGAMTASASITSTSSMFSPIYYDNDNSAYYINPADTSITKLQWIKCWNGTAASPTEYTDWPTPALTISHFGNYTSQTMLAFTLPNDGNYFTGDTVWNFRLSQTANSTTSAGVNTMNFAGPGSLYFGPSNFTQSAGSFRAPVWYDSDNTGYYLDANSTGTSLNVAGAIVAAGNITAYSDITLKENIQYISDATSKVMRIRGVTYSRNDLRDKTKEYAGVIAQEIQEVLPQAVSSDSDKLSVDYNAVVALLIEAIKEQQSQITALEAKVEAILAKLK